MIHLNTLQKNKQTKATSSCKLKSHITLSHSKSKLPIYTHTPWKILSYSNLSLSLVSTRWEKLEYWLGYSKTEH